MNWPVKRRPHGWQQGVRHCVGRLLRGIIHSKEQGSTPLAATAQTADRAAPGSQADKFAGNLAVRVEAQELQAKWSSIERGSQQPLQVAVAAQANNGEPLFLHMTFKHHCQHMPRLGN